MFIYILTVKWDANKDDKRDHNQLDNGWLLASEQTRLHTLASEFSLQTPAQVYLCLFVACTCGLYCNYTEREYIIWQGIIQFYQCSMVKPLVMMTCDFMFLKPSIDSEQFYLPNFTHKFSMFFRCFPITSRAGIISPGLYFEEFTSLKNWPWLNFNWYRMIGMLIF